MKTGENIAKDISACFVYITCKDKTEALNISKHLLKDKLIACANIIEGMSSVYEWKGEVVEDTETILIAKTLEVQMQTLNQRVIELHSYEIPCIVSLPIMDGNKAYVQWIDKQVRREN